MPTDQVTQSDELNSLLITAHKRYRAAVASRDDLVAAKEWAAVVRLRNQ